MHTPFVTRRMAVCTPFMAKLAATSTSFHAHCLRGNHLSFREGRRSRYRMDWQRNCRRGKKCKRCERVCEFYHNFLPVPRPVPYARRNSNSVVRHNKQNPMCSRLKECEDRRVTIDRMDEKSGAILPSSSRLNCWISHNVLKCVAASVTQRR
jgi:hypothetical protein